VAWSLWIMRPQPLLSHHPRWRVAMASHLHGEEPPIPSTSTGFAWRPRKKSTRRTRGLIADFLSLGSRRGPPGRAARRSRPRSARTTRPTPTLRPGVTRTRRASAACPEPPAWAATARGPAPGTAPHRRRRRHTNAPPAARGSAPEPRRSGQGAGSTRRAPQATRPPPPPGQGRSSS